MPVDKGAIISTLKANHVALYLDGPRNSVYSRFIWVDYIGQPFDLLPGNTLNRLRVLNYDKATDDFALGWAGLITLAITSRTRHLIGMI